MEEQAFTEESLARFDGRDGRPAYVAYQGKVYDVTGSRYGMAAIIRASTGLGPI